MNLEKTFFELSARDILGKELAFGNFRGKVVLVVNVASKCGFTPQYKALEELFKKYQTQGLLVLGFPCNQFGAQEPASETEIQQFCSLTYDVTFPMFAKVKVNGPDTHPVYEFLKNQQSGILGTKSIKWNFTKFLIDKQGRVIGRYGPQIRPEQIEKDIEKALAQQ
jgi:glutathione peroxidase